MRKVVLSLAAGLLAASVVVPAAAKGKPGGGTMPAQSAYGLCKAYFAGSENGQAHKRKAPPFQDLAAKADAMDQTVEEFCAAQTPGAK
jgi:hypothetical protein